MIANLKSYPAMKDSGVPWLGKVPEHWEVRRLRSADAMRFAGIVWRLPAFMVNAAYNMDSILLHP